MAGAVFFTPRTLRSEEECMRTMYILRNDDRPTDRPADRPRILENFERPYLGNGSSDPLHVWFCGRVFEVGGSNGPNSGCTKSKWKISNGHISGTGRPIDFVFDPMLDFSGAADRMDLLLVAPNPRFGRPRSWKISNDHISGISYPIRFHELQSSLEE